MTVEEEEKRTVVVVVEEEGRWSERGQNAPHRTAPRQTCAKGQSREKDPCVFPIRTAPAGAGGGGPAAG